MIMPRIKSEDVFSNVVEFNPQRVMNQVRAHDEQDIRSRIGSQEELIESFQGGFEGNFNGFAPFDVVKDKIEDFKSKLTGGYSETNTQIKPENKLKLFYEKNKTILIVSASLLVVATGVLIYKKSR